MNITELKKKIETLNGVIETYDEKVDALYEDCDEIIVEGGDESCRAAGADELCKGCNDNSYEINFIKKEIIQLKELIVFLEN